jgi:hypothetical protein
MTSVNHTERTLGIGAALALAGALALLWISMAWLRPDTTLHLGPVLVPVVPAITVGGGRLALRATIIAGGIGATAIIALGMLGLLGGPALQPFPNAAIESIVFLLIGITIGAFVARVQD